MAIWHMADQAKGTTFRMSSAPVTTDQPTPKRRRAQVRYKIARLPADVRKELDDRLVSGGFTDYRGLSDWLAGKGFEISPSALNYYAHRFEQRLRAVKLATTQARAIVEAAAGDDDRINQALMRMVQTTMFEMMVEMNETRHAFEAADEARARSKKRLLKRAVKKSAGKEVDGDGVADDSDPAPKYPTKADLAAMGSVGRTVAALGKLELEWEKWRAQMKRHVERQVDTAKERVSEAVKEGGLSPDAEARIRSALLEIRV